MREKLKKFLLKKLNIMMKKGVKGGYLILTLLLFCSNKVQAVLGSDEQVILDLEEIEQMLSEIKKNKDMGNDYKIFNVLSFSIYEWSRACYIAHEKEWDRLCRKNPSVLKDFTEKVAEANALYEQVRIYFYLPLQKSYQQNFSIFNSFVENHTKALLAKAPPLEGFVKRIEAIIENFIKLFSLLCQERDRLIMDDRETNRLVFKHLRRT